MARKHAFDYDLVVIGSGAGGSGAATIAAKSGKRVAIIEAEIFGGDSPNWGDVPIKSLLHAATLYDEAKSGARFGLRSSTIGYNYPSLRAWKDLAVKRTGAGDNRKYYENQGIDTYVGRAHFLSPNEISVNRRHISAGKFLIATGATWAVPNIPGIDTIKYLTPKTVLETLKPPKSLMIIGGGAIAIEIAQLMAIFGTKVYVIERAERILPDYDVEVSDTVARILSEQKGITILTHARVESLERDTLHKRAIISREGHQNSIKVDEVLVATGRRPNVDLGLENANIQYTAKGIDANNYLQTNVKHIFAAGSVLGRGNNTQMTLLDSQIAANNILKRTKVESDHTGTIQTIFTFPGVAMVGLSEDDCLKRDLGINQAIAPLNIIGRSNTSDFRDGFVKIITDKKKVIIGASVVAPHASEIIHELAVAVKYKMTAQELIAVPHAFLSWSEAVRVAAGKLV